MPEKRKKQRTHGRGLDLLVYIFLALYTLFTLVPIYWVFTTSVKSSEEVVQFPPSLLPKMVSFDHYHFVFTKTKLGRGILNSLIVSGLTTLIALIVASLAGYAFSRFRFRGKQLLIGSVLGLYLIPPLINVIPLFLLFNKLGLLNTYWGLVLAYQALVLPLVTFLLRNYFDGIPIEIEEAALIDGCTRLGVLWRVTLPLALPGISTAAIFSFILSWNEFVLALNFLFKDDLKTVQLVIMEFVKLHRIDWGALTAAMVVGMIPVLLFLVIAQRYLIAGLLGGATKY
ncbi:MAG: carbohydrate ABC transporter permease [Thermotogae bacterium]|nr:carbohydrate ABC transporter permease [Thermotogota bacterium]RKX44114.1 MAG: carbohydrate ABC transporter permease [Thermotogota bacterium]